MKEKFDAIVARDLQVQDLSGLSSVYPRHKAFVFEDEPLYFCGRIGKSEEPAFKLGAVTGEGQWSREVELEFEGATRSPIAGELWAELRLNELKGKLLLDPANEEARRGLAELSKDFPMLKPSELGCFIESKGPLPSPSAVPNLELRETPKGVPTPSPKPGSSKGRKPAKSPKPTATPRRSGR